MLRIVGELNEAASRQLTILIYRGRHLIVPATPSIPGWSPIDVWDLLNRKFDVPRVVEAKGVEVVVGVAKGRCLDLGSSKPVRPQSDSSHFLGYSQHNTFIVIWVTSLVPAVW